MTRTSANDLDYLTTRLHARRSRMAEGERLDALCRVRTLPELTRLTHPGVEIFRPADFQRRLVLDCVQEIGSCLNHLDGKDQSFVEWLAVRFQCENLKVLLRGFLNRTPLVKLQKHLVALPGNLELDAESLLAAKSREEFVRRIPPDLLCRHLRLAVVGHNHSSQPFILEAALDAGYLEELLVRGARLSGSEWEIVCPMIFHEVNHFQFMLIVRGRFHFGLAPEILKPLRVNGSGINPEWINALLFVPDVLTAAKCGVGVVLDDLPVPPPAEEKQTPMDIAFVESLAWKRFLRLANGAFRRSHLGVAALAGYLGIRRVEIANLITLSEGIRLGLNEHACRARMIPQMEMEAAHV